MLHKYEMQLTKEYHLPDKRCLYTPDVYWKLTNTQRQTLDKLRRVGA